jgi:hypothetical protein
MNIHRTNHTRKSDKSTDRVKCTHDGTENFEVTCKPDGTVTIHARYMDYDWDIVLSRIETEHIRSCLNRVQPNDLI